MAIVVSLVGLLIAAVGVALAVAPKRLTDWIAALDPARRFWTAVLVRVAMGGVFLIAAPACRHPLVVEVVGFIALIAAVTILLMGRTRLDAMLAWWLDRPPSFLRGWSVVAVGFGALLLYAGA